VSQTILVQDVKTGKVALCAIGQRVVVGRDTDTDLPCRDKHVSRRHCELIAQTDGRLRIMDTSTYGTFVGSDRIEEMGYAGAGDTIVIGRDYNLRVLGVLQPGSGVDDGCEPEVPARINEQYVLLRLVARGGMGILYEGYDEEHKRRCAIKWLKAGGPATEEMRERFTQEAVLQGRLGDYPGIVSVWDLVSLPGSEMFCVMEFIDGASLEYRVRQEDLDPMEGVRLAARICRAVHYAHEHGIIHRDVKPSNVMITPGGQVRLTDFGVSKALEGGDGGMTATGVMLGTPGYMSPEQIEDARSVTHLSDVYGLGAVLYFVLTGGRLPARGERLSEALRSIRKGDFPPPREHDPNIDPLLEGICLQALSTDPHRRQSSAKKLADDLEQWLKRVKPPEKVKLQPPTTT
jgi:eukaryotic-like serine/threonine-protein kinase